MIFQDPKVHDPVQYFYKGGNQSLLYSFFFLPSEQTGPVERTNFGTEKVCVHSQAEITPEATRLQIQ